MKRNPAIIHISLQWRLIQYERRKTMKITNILKEWSLILLNLIAFHLMTVAWAFCLLWTSFHNHAMIVTTAILIGIGLSIPLMILAARTIRSKKRWLLSLPIQIILTLLYWAIVDQHSLMRDTVTYICIAVVPCVIQALGLGFHWCWAKIK